MNNFQITEIISSINGERRGTLRGTVLQIVKKSSRKRKKREKSYKIL